VSAAAGARRRSHEPAGRQAEPAMRRLPATEHTSRPWRIHELAGDFRLEDVWALPTPGGPADFPRLVRLVAGGLSQGSPAAARILWAARRRLGDLLHWDDPGAGASWPSLRGRLPSDLLASAPVPSQHGFSSLYLTGNEWASELANKTMHGVLHLSWVPAGDGGYRGQLAVLVRPNGLLGAGYMAGIRPFRYLIIYPAMGRQLELRWRTAPIG
jgi:Protein of unknown function (DUF2867)